MLDCMEQFAGQTCGYSAGLDVSKTRISMSEVEVGVVKSMLWPLASNGTMSEEAW